MIVKLLVLFFSRENTGAAAAVAWVECVLGLGEYFAASAILHSATFFATGGLDTAWRRLLDGTLVTCWVFWSDARFTGMPLLRYLHVELGIQAKLPNGAMKHVAETAAFHAFALFAVVSALLCFQSSEINYAQLLAAASDSARAWGPGPTVDALLLAPVRHICLLCFWPR